MVEVTALFVVKINQRTVSVMSQKHMAVQWVYYKKLLMLVDMRDGFVQGSLEVAILQCAAIHSIQTLCKEFATTML